MGRYRSSHIAGPCLCLALAAIALSSCTRRDAAAIDGVVVFDEDIQLARGQALDSAQREIRIDANASIVAFVYEDDCDVTLRLELAAGERAPARFSAVNNSMLGESLEVAILDVPRDSHLLVRLESALDFDTPCHVRTRVLRYDAAMASDPRVAARLPALRAWARATHADRTANDSRTTGLGDMDQALVQLESAEGDRWLAAWARIVRSNLNYENEIDHHAALRDARTGLAAFSALRDARNAARSRYALACSLREIALDARATDPTAEQASREAVTILKELSNDPDLSPLERARSVNMLGGHASDMAQRHEADQYYREALSAFRALGARRDQRMLLNNIGTLKSEQGEFLPATQYFDELVGMLDQVGEAKSRMLYLYNAALADVNAGFVDRAIERLTGALKQNRDRNDPLMDARFMLILGYGYWSRGDVAQASAFLQESTRLRRMHDDPRGLMTNLRYAGAVARATGKIDEALKLHREALTLSVSEDARLRVMLELARDYAAIQDYGRAIASCREALTFESVSKEYFKRYEVQLALGDLLLRQPAANAAAIAEAEALSAAPLDAAIRRNDLNLEIAARDLRARIFARRRQWTEARAEYERAVGLIFRYSTTSSNPDLQALAVARARSTFQGYVDLLMREAAINPDGVLRPASPDERDALQMLEWARETNFSSARAATLDKESNTRIDALLTEMAGKRVRIASLLERGMDSGREVEKLQVEIASLRAEIDRIRAQASRAASPSKASALGAPELPALPTNVAQWSYALGNERVYLWTRDGESIRAAVLPLSPGDLELRVSRLDEKVRSRSAEEWQAGIQRLAAVLLPHGAMQADAADIEIVADGSLAKVPFAGLLGSAAGSAAMIRSMFHTTAVADAGQHALRFVGVAGSSGGQGTVRGGVFPALLATAGEARSIAALFEIAGGKTGIKLLLGADGSATALASMWRSGIDVLHVATHGLADLRQPMTSLLMLPATDTAGKPTYLTAGQVQEWRGDVKLVYLSACETAIGPARFADGMPGLQRAFLRAGAHGVIATLWPIEDAYASEFATDFYRKYTAGVPAAQALAETHRAWMQPVAGLRAGEQVHRRMTAWAHAYFAR